MRKWTLATLMLILGFLLGVLAAGLFFRPSGSGHTLQSRGDKVKAVIVNDAIASGAVVGPDVLSSFPVPVELMMGGLIAKEHAAFVFGLKSSESLKRGDLLRWSDFSTDDILAAVSPSDKVDPGAVHGVFSGDQPAPGLPIRSYNAARRRDERYFDCFLFLSGPAVLLKRIECVEYMLHPSFDEPKKKICRQEADPVFSLRFSAWGTFDIPVRVTMQDGQTLEWVHGLHF